MKKVGIIGGTFNPVHMAHLIIADIAQETAELDEVLFIPTGCSYLKDPDEIAPAKDRVSMTGLAIEDNPSFALSTIEVEREGRSYTCDTLMELKERYPEQEYYLIIGADNLFSMEEWKNPEIIFENCRILAAIRGGKKRNDMEEQIAYLEQKYKADITLLPIKHIDISSSMIREKVAAGKSIRYMLPEKVRGYILRKQLYRKPEQEQDES